MVENEIRGRCSTTKIDSSFLCNLTPDIRLCHDSNVYLVIRVYLTPRAFSVAVGELVVVGELIFVRRNQR